MANGEKDIAVIADGMAEQLRNINGELRGIKGISGVLKAAPKVIEAVEKAGFKNDWHGIDKKAVAVAVIIALVPLPPWLPKAWAAFILNYAIEKAVAQFNSNAAPTAAGIWKTVKGWFGGGAKK